MMSSMETEKIARAQEGGGALDKNCKKLKLFITRLKMARVQVQGARASSATGDDHVGGKLATVPGVGLKCEVVAGLWRASLKISCNFSPCRALEICLVDEQRRAQLRTIADCATGALASRRRSSWTDSFAMLPCCSAARLEKVAKPDLNARGESSERRGRCCGASSRWGVIDQLHTLGEFISCTIAGPHAVDLPPPPPSSLRGPSRRASLSLPSAPSLGSVHHVTPPSSASVELWSITFHERDARLLHWCVALLRSCPSCPLTFPFGLQSELAILHCMNLI